MKLEDKLFEVEFDRPLFLEVRDYTGNTEVFNMVDEASSATRIPTLTRVVGYITKAFIPESDFWNNQGKYLNGAADLDKELYHLTVNPFQGKSSMSILDGGGRRAGDIKIPLRYVKEIKPVPVFNPELISNIP